MRLIDDNPHLPNNSYISTTSEIEPDDFSSHRISCNNLDMNGYGHRQGSNICPQPLIIVKKPLSEHSSSINDSDQEFIEDYSHQIDCLKEEMLTEFPSNVPGIVPLYDTSRHNSCAIISFPQSLEFSDDFNSFNFAISEEIDLRNFAIEFIESVIEFAKNITDYETKEESGLNESVYFKLITDISEDLVARVIQDSMNKISRDNFNSCGNDDDLSPVLEPDSPCTEDGDFFGTYNDIPIIHMEHSQKSDVINKVENNLGLIIVGSGEDCDMAPLSPIMECFESDKSQELLLDYKKSESDYIETSEKEDMYNCDEKMEDSHSSSSRECEDFDCDKFDGQSTMITLLCKSPSTDYVNPLIETAIMDDGGDVSETQSFNSTPSSQQCSVICASRRAESLQHIDSESAAGLAIDLLSSESRTTSMSSSIMQTSFHSTDSVTLTATTTASTLVKITQPYDDLNSLSDQISPGCLSSG